MMELANWKCSMEGFSTSQYRRPLHLPGLPTGLGVHPLNALRISTSEMQMARILIHLQVHRFGRLDVFPPHTTDYFRYIRLRYIEACSDVPLQHPCLRKHP